MVNPITVGNFAFLFYCTPVGQTSDSMMFRLKDLSINEMVGAWCFGCLRAHRDLPVRFILHRYLVLFNVESLSLLYLLVIFWFICSRRMMMHWWIRGLSCKPNIYVSWSTSDKRVRLAPLNPFKPSSKIFYWPFQGGTSFVDLLCFCSALCLLCHCARLLICVLW